MKKGIRNVEREKTRIEKHENRCQWNRNQVMGDVVNEDAYISLTDIAKYKNPDNAFIVVANWMRNHSTISFLGLWEQIHNPNFKPIEFDRFKAESGLKVITYDELSDFSDELQNEVKRILEMSR